MRIAEKHTNSRGFAHAGLLTTFCDIALGYTTAFAADPPAAYVTVHLDVDFASSAKVGDWIEVRVDVQKRGSRIAFANAYVTVGSERIARASAIFAGKAA
jgi:acyl-coenzyme A thioesterase PaaI-like protein